VVSVVLPSAAAGLVASIGVDDSIGAVVAIGDSAGLVVVVVVVVSDEVVSAGDAAGAAVSVFCSHATRSAALARMQIYFFIGCG
jgi:hypothetical protein